MIETPKPLIKVQHIKKSFKKRYNQDLLVLDDVNFDLKQNEIVALLGKSGSGKSTILRIIAGLIKPTTGQVLYNDQPIIKPVQGMSMVFQHFGLLPWLTVLQNVELGLEAQHVPRQERRDRALATIDMVGLDGFESAYPKELSGGMCQRVGFARALVVNSEILLMDEPFSALDVLTSENLRNDLMDLWQQQKTLLKSMLIVTHNIEEAALLADRLLIFSANPGYVRAEMHIDLPHPRQTQSPKFIEIVDNIYTLMTRPEKVQRTFHISQRLRTQSIGYRLPNVEVSMLSGFLETMHSPEYEQRIDLPDLAEALHLDVDNLFPVTGALEILQFAKVSQGDIELTKIGKQFIKADILAKKKIFAKQLISHVPLISHIYNTLQQRSGHRIGKDTIVRQLKNYLSEEASNEVFRIAIDWGRYAEVFAYDANTEMLSFEDP